MSLMVKPLELEGLRHRKSRGVGKGVQYKFSDEEIVEQWRFLGNNLLNRPSPLILKLGLLYM